MQNKMADAGAGGAPAPQGAGAAAGQDTRKPGKGAPQKCGVGISFSKTEIGEIKAGFPTPHISLLTPPSPPPLLILKGNMQCAA